MNRIKGPRWSLNHACLQICLHAFFSFIVLVPCAFVLAVLSKIRHVMAVIAKPRKTDDALEQRQRAFDLQVPSRRRQSSTMQSAVLSALTSNICRCSGSLNTARGGR